MTATLSREQALDILGVPHDAEKTTIDAAIKRAFMRYHPDRGGDRDLFEMACKARDVVLDTTPCEACNGTKKIVEKQGFCTLTRKCTKCN